MTLTEAVPAAPPALDGARWRDDCERITNNALLEEWLALYHDDAVCEWMADGAYERYDGRAAIEQAASAQASLWRSQRLRVKKTLECTDDDTVVLSWRGGFRGGDSQFGVEIWTLRDGLVVRHQMYLYMDARPRASRWAQLRVLLASPRIALSLPRHERRARRDATSGASVTRDGARASISGGVHR